jgi:chromosome partitioning protein
MRIVAVINYKGGVGKTSLTANLAAELAWRKYKVLLIDLDPQASLTFSFIRPDEWEKSFAANRTIKSWFESFEVGAKPLSLASLIHKPNTVANRLVGHGQLDMICSHLGLINVDLELATKLGGASLVQAKKNFLTIHRRLAEGVAALDQTSYDVLLIDCPPNFNIVTKTAIIASDYILVPARPDYLSTLGIDYLIRSVNGLIKDYNDFAAVEHGEKTSKIDPKILGVVFTMIQEYANGPIQSQRPFMDKVKQMKGLTVFPHYIKRNDSLFADAPQYGVPVVLHHYASGSHQSVVEGLEGVTEDFGHALKLW